MRETEVNVKDKQPEREIENGTWIELVRTYIERNFKKRGWAILFS